MIRGLALAALLLAAAPVAHAETPGALTSLQDRQSVVDLAYVLGEAHALHRLCAGAEDNTWRARMRRLLQVETPDAAFRQQLTGSFNAGFVAQSAQFPTCTLKSAQAERSVAAKGRELARSLATGVSP